MEKLLLNNLWPEIKRLSQKSSRTDAAIAYFTSDKFLKLKAGDSLIVNASTQAIQTGGTSAELLWTLRNDVRLFNLPSLHAKVILLDDQLFVGSANASETSADNLQEAGVLIDSPQIVSQARSFLYQLSQMAEELTEERLRKLLKIKVRRPCSVGGTRKRKIVAAGDRVWIVSSTDSDEDEFANEENAVTQAERRIQKTHPNAEPYWIRWPRKSRIPERAMPGDTLIASSKEAKRKIPYVVHPPTSLLHCQRRGEWTRFYFDPDLSAPLKPIDWSTFRKLLKQAGVKKKVTPKTNCELSVRNFLELHRLWPRKRRSSSRRQA
jgi:prolyl oligopeptidase PreP (S9A serine peptidase family)